MDWTYAGQMALSLLIFAPGVVLLALYLLVGPFISKRAAVPKVEKVKTQEPVPAQPRRSTGRPALGGHPK